jgi:RNA polymerase sigma factor for flagellar operon FliA
LQEGAIGLLQAMDRFDPNGGAAFSTFAVRRIRGQIMDAIRTASGSRRKGPKPRVLRLDYEFDSTHGFNLSAQSGQIPDDDPSVDPFERHVAAANLARARQAVASIVRPRDRHVLSLYAQGLTHREIAVVLGVSEGRIAQLARRAVGDLQTALAEG